MSLKEFIKAAGRAFNCLIPKNKNKILFESNSDYCDNSRAVYDYMQKNGFDKKYHFVWCVKNPAVFLTVHQAVAKDMKNTSFTSFHTRKYFLSYLFHIVTSKTVIYTHFVPPFVNPAVQTVVNLWHGTPLKNIKGHVHPSELFSYLLSPSPQFDNILADSFSMDTKKLIHCGYPRNDLLFDKTNSLSLLNVEKKQYDKVILWMPTFRKNPISGTVDCEATQTGLPLIATETLLEQLNNKLAELNQFMIIKLHPAQSGLNLAKTDFTNMKMLTNAHLDQSGVQLYHLVCDCDVLLTDYSSIYFDFLLLNRPIGFIIDDIGQYTKNRGFVTDNPYELMPGMKINTLEELFEFLHNIKDNNDSYCPARVKVNSIVNQYTDANSSKRLLEFLHITL